MGSKGDSGDEGQIGLEGLKGFQGDDGQKGFENIFSNIWFKNAKRILLKAIVDKLEVKVQ